MKIRNRRSRFSKKYPLLTLGVMTAVTAAAVMWVWAANRTPKTETPSSTETANQATSEGGTFPVPDDLPDNTVQDYVLITENELYKIRQYGNTNRYIITLYAIINNPSQYTAYQDQLREYKQKALAYLRDTGVNTNNIEITYEPQEAKDL